MQRTKIGDNYYRSGYGRGRRKMNVYLIDNYAYASDTVTWMTDKNQMKGQFVGYVRVNLISRAWFQVSGEDIDKHLPVACDYPQSNAKI